MADDPVLDRVLLVNEPDFRVVRIELADGNAEHVLERKDGLDAMGVQRWSAFNTHGSKTLDELFKYFIRIVEKQYEHQ